MNISNKSAHLINLTMIIIIQYLLEKKSYYELSLHLKL